MSPAGPGVRESVQMRANGSVETIEKIRLEGRTQQRLTFPSGREDVQAVASNTAELFCNRKLLRPLLTFSLTGHQVCTGAAAVAFKHTNTLLSDMRSHFGKYYQVRFHGECSITVTFITKRSSIFICCLFVTFSFLIHEI